MKDNSRTNGVYEITKIYLVIMFFLMPSILLAQQANLLVIHTDEHNFRTLGCYRDLMADEQAYIWGEGVKVTTPNIDFLASEGVLCTSFYANTPVCTPSRAALISGKYPQNTPSSKNDIPLFDNIESYAAPLIGAGYVTGYMGKWHLDGDGKPQWAPQRKFGFEDNKYMWNRGHWKKLDENENGPFVAAVNKKGNISYALDDADEKTFTTDFLTTRAIQFIENNKDQAFCLHLSIPDPHGPNTVRAPYDKMFIDLPFETPTTADKSSEGLPEWGQMKDQTISKVGLANYFGMVKCIDDNIGRLINYLKEEDILENTVIVFVSDHGDMLGEHKRDNKGVPYEASAKVPFIIRYPAKLKSGVVVNEAMSNVDFKPTILSLLGIQPGIDSEGKDVSSLFLKGVSNPIVEGIAFIRGTDTKKENWVGIVSDRYKLIYAKNSEPWLFDLELDPNEIVNYYTQPAYKEIIRMMALKLKDYGTTYSDPYLNDAKIKAEIDLAIVSTGSNNISASVENILVYPNPTDKSLIFIEGLVRDSLIVIFDSSGGRLKRQMTNKTVDISGLKKGFYILSINSNKYTKFMVI